MQMFGELCALGEGMSSIPGRGWGIPRGVGLGLSDQNGPDARPSPEQPQVRARRAGRRGKGCRNETSKHSLESQE